MDAVEIENTGLLYTTDDMPGIRLKEVGGKAKYIDTSGAVIRCDKEKDRISQIGVPPAYENVWICPEKQGHLQATAYDDRGRKQYFYHPDWQGFRSQIKFSQLIPFGEALPRLRRRIRKDLEGDVGDLEFAAAALTLLLDKTGIRVGNSRYYKENKTYGATTLRPHHVLSDGSKITLKYHGKGGRRIQRTIRHKKLNHILERISDLPGKELFTYRKADGGFGAVDSRQLNEYISEATALEHVSAKTFRTWSGSVVAFEAALDNLEASGVPPTIKLMCEAAAGRLANTPTICRNSYIHPSIINLADPDGISILEKLVKDEAGLKPRSELRKSEELMLQYLSSTSRE